MNRARMTLLVGTICQLAAAVPVYHYGLGNGLLPGGMGDPQLYWCVRPSQYYQSHFFTGRKYGTGILAGY